MRPLPIALSLSLAIATLGARSAAQKVPDARINTGLVGTGSVITPKAKVATALDDVFVVWRDERNGSPDIYFNRSTDRGSTWLPVDVRLDTDPAGASASEDPVLVANDSEVLVAWTDDRAGEPRPYFNRSSDGGVTWLATDLPISSEAGASSSLQLAAVGSDVYALWIDDRNGGADVYFNRSSDGGLTWQPVDLRLSLSPDASEAQLAVSGSWVYAAWAASDCVLFAAAGDSGVTWSQEREIDLFGWPLTGYPRMAVSGRSVYVVWENASQANLFGFNVWMARSTDNGTIWSGARPISADEFLGFGPKPPVIAAAGPMVYVAWGYLGRVRFNRSADYGETWALQDTELTTVNVTDPTSLALAASGQHVFLAWEEIVAGMHANRSADGGATWLGENIPLFTPPGNGNSEGLAVAASDEAAYAVWGDGRNGHWDVYFNIPYGMQRYGTGLAGSGGFVPVLAGHGLPVGGQTVNLHLDSALGGAPAALIVGAARAAIPILGGTLLVQPLLAPPVLLGGSAGVPGAGDLSVPLGLPVDEAFVGVPLFFQVLPLDAAAPGGVSMSNAVELWIG
jgi:hypothetical protein